MPRVASAALALLLAFAASPLAAVQPAAAAVVPPLPADAGAAEPAAKADPTNRWIVVYNDDTDLKAANGRPREVLRCYKILWLERRTIPQTGQAGRGPVGLCGIEEHEIHGMSGVVVQPDPASCASRRQRRKVPRYRRYALFGTALGVEERRPDARPVHLRRDHGTAVRRNEGVLDVPPRIVQQKAYGPLFPHPQPAVG